MRRRNVQYLESDANISEVFEVCDVIDDAKAATSLVKGNFLSRKRDNASLL